MEKGAKALLCPYKGCYYNTNIRSGLLKHLENIHLKKFTPSSLKVSIFYYRIIK